MADETELGHKYLPPPDTTWQKNAPSQIVLDSIFATLAGILIGLSLQDSSAGTWHRLVELFLSLFAFILFARSAEGTTDALDQRDVRQFLLPHLVQSRGDFPNCLDHNPRLCQFLGTLAFVLYKVFRVLLTVRFAVAYRCDLLHIFWYSY